jgi:hypothetical protein
MALSYGNLEWKPFHGAVEAEVEDERYCNIIST